MAKWVKWNTVCVQHEVAFLQLSLPWGFSEDVLYLGNGNYRMLFCFFEYWYIYVLRSIFFEIFVSEIIYSIHQLVVIVQNVWHLLSLRNNLFVLARQITAIVHWAKPFGCEKLNKEILNSLAHIHVSDIFVFRFAKLGRPLRRTLLRRFQSWLL